MFVVDHTLVDLCQLSVQIWVRVTALGEIVEGWLSDFWDLSGEHPDLVEEIVILAIV